MRISLRSRLALTLSLFLVVTAVAVSVIWWNGLKGLAQEAEATAIANLEKASRDDLQREGEAIAEMLADSLVNPTYFFDIYAIGENIRVVKARPLVDYVMVFDAEGRIIHDGDFSVPRFGETMDDRFAEGATAAASTTSQWSDSVLDVTAPLLLDGEHIGGVRVGLSLASTKVQIENLSNSVRVTTRSKLRQTRLAVLGAVAGLVLVALLAAAWASRNLSRPISQLLTETRKIGSGAFQEVNARSNRSDELGQLMREFRSMSAAIQRNTAEIRHLAYHDSLSGLPNRLHFREFLEQMVRRQREHPEHRVALLFLDLDDFKRINDNLGHDGGDRLLVAFGRRLENSVHRALIDQGIDRHLVARLGGDEFTVALYGENAESVADHVSREILRALDQPIKLDGQIHHCSTSIGIAVFPDDAYSADVLIKNADIAMYCAKAAGKNRFLRFEKTRWTSPGSRDDLEKSLRSAVANGRFHIVYQPIFDLTDQSIVAVEALLRADQDRLSRISPAAFIPVAEELGLMDSLGRWMLQRAIEEAADWPANVMLAVNLSPSQVRDPAIAADINDYRSRACLPRQRLVIEVAEAAIGKAGSSASLTLNNLRDAGIRIWLDDFGHGFSGLAQLKHRAIDGVKIDRNFVADISRNAGDLALARAVVETARSLGISVVAEGIEDDSQLESLRETGCPWGQGYFLARPSRQVEFPTTSAKTPHQAAPDGSSGS